MWGGTPPPIKPGEVGEKRPGERRSFRPEERKSWWEVSSRCPTVPQQDPSKSACVGLPEQPWKNENQLIWFPPVDLEPFININKTDHFDRRPEPV